MYHLNECMDDNSIDRKTTDLYDLRYFLFKRSLNGNNLKLFIINFLSLPYFVNTMYHLECEIY